MTQPSLLESLQWQLRVGWSLLAEHHLPRMTDESCLWLPHPSAHAVRPNADGEWVGDWHEPEPGVPWHATVGWQTWHLQGWLSGAIAEARQLDVLAQEKIRWPGNADATRIELTRLAEEWSTVRARVNSTCRLRQESDLRLSETDLGNAIRYSFGERGAQLAFAHGGAVLRPLGDRDELAAAWIDLHDPWANGCLSDRADRFGGVMVEQVPVPQPGAVAPRWLGVDLDGYAVRRDERLQVFKGAPRERWHARRHMRRIRRPNEAHRVATTSSIDVPRQHHSDDLRPLHRPRAERPAELDARW